MEPVVRCKNHPEVTEGCAPCSRCGDTFCADCRVELDGREYCPDCKVEYLRDLQAGVTAAGRLAYASIGRRFGAHLIDSFLFGLPYGVVIFYMAATGQLEEGTDPQVGGCIAMAVALLWATVGRLVYEGSMLAHSGQTLGKRAMSVKVVTPEGRDLRPGQAWGRAALHLLFESCVSLIDYIPAFFTAEKTTLHDMAARTRVVDVRPGA